MSDPQHPDHPDHHPETIARNARNGLILFFIYLALYAGFMVLNTFAPTVMASRPFGGVNLALIYGFGLIGAAFGLALIYLALCRTDRKDS